MKFFPTALLLVLLTGIISGQDKKEFKRGFFEAEYFFMLEEYEEAAFLYNELLQVDPGNANLQFLCGASYLSFGNSQKAINYLERSVSSISSGYREGSFRERNAPKEAFFALAKAYHMLNRLDLAEEYYSKYKNVMLLRDVASIEFVNKQFRSIELAKSMLNDTLELSSYPLFDDQEFFSNSYNPVFAPGDSTLLFMSDKPFYSAILMSHFKNGLWSKPKVINGMIMIDGKVKLSSISYDGNELFISRTENFNTDIWSSKLIDDRWSQAIPVNGINTEFNETHASLNKNGDVLFFTSDRPDGYGALDIYVVYKNKDGNWGEAENLGKPVNSIYSEESPYLAEDDKTLFFSSMGHPTMGGYDIFYSTKLPTGKWSYPVNMGFPVSTTSDDLNFFPLKNGNKALYSGNSDFFRKNQINLIDLDSGSSTSSFSLKGKIETEDNAFITRETRVRILHKDSIESLIYLNPDPNTGKYNTVLPKGEYEIQISSPGYDTLFEVINIQNERKVMEVNIENSLRPEELGKGVYILAKNILFDFDSELLTNDAKFALEKLYHVMSYNPELLIELTGHTDSKGSYEYNLKLSHRRTQSVLDYLVSRGISRDRFISKALGEDQNVAINKHKDGSDSPEGRRFNRQVVIKLLNNNQAKDIWFESYFVPDHLRPEADKKYYVILNESSEKINTTNLNSVSDEIKLFETENNNIYAAGDFNTKKEALDYLGKIAEVEFPEARIVTKDEFADLLEPLNQHISNSKGPFTIQIMALLKPVNLNHFTDPSDIISIQGSDKIYRYIVGIFDDYSKAEEKLSVYVLKGFSDSFILPLAHLSSSKENENKSLPDLDYFFTIQFSATLNEVDPNRFRNIKNVIMTKGDDDFYRYSSGLFLNKTQADLMLLKIKNEGFEDAFIKKVFR